MTVDNSDKTVFRQPKPGGGGDRTVMRPTPGRPPAGQPTADSAGVAFAPPPPQAALHKPAAVAPRSSQRQAASPAPPSSMDRVQFSDETGLNPLVNAAAALLTVYQKTCQAINHSDVGGLYQRLVNEVRTFETNAQQQGIPSEVILSARYVLCTALDEAVLNTPWGSESPWGQRTLLTVFHNETFGGEKFYLILDRMRATPAENIDILELMYILLSLGFEGKYRLSDRGRDTIEQIRDELFRIIRNYRGEYERDLSSHWQGLGKTRNTLGQFVPMWVIASVVGAVLLLSYSGFRVWLYRSSSPVVEQLTAITESAPIKDNSADADE